MTNTSLLMMVKSRKTHNNKFPFIGLFKSDFQNNNADGFDAFDIYPWILKHLFVGWIVCFPAILWFYGLQHG